MFEKIGMHILKDKIYHSSAFALEKLRILSIIRSLNNFFVLIGSFSFSALTFLLISRLSNYRLDNSLEESLIITSSVLLTISLIGLYRINNKRAVQKSVGLDSFESKSSRSFQTEKEILELLLNFVKPYIPGANPPSKDRIDKIEKSLAAIGVALEAINEERMQGTVEEEKSPSSANCANLDSSDSINNVVS
ncbi:hypothetical protein N9O57_00965 [bacterium]|nr:hypothetical protein [bacterium]